MARDRYEPDGDTLDAGWTPRQREVLDLLARRYSNAEIAEKLGITLNGAKWHVHEILDKLGVDSREDAAEYWRRHNGLRSRLGRMFTGAMAGIGLKAAGGAGALVVAAGFTVALVALWPAQGDKFYAAEPGSDGNPLALRGDPDADGFYSNLARGAGVLVHEGECLYIEYGSVGAALDGSLSPPRRWLPAFHASNASWDADREVLRIDDEEFEMGDPIAIGGSEGNLANVDWHVPPDSSCDQEEGWIAGGAEKPGGSEAFAIEAGPVASRLRLLVPDRIAGSWIEEEPRRRVVLSFTGGGDGLDEVRARADEAPVPVEIRTGADHSLRELGDAILAIRSDLAEVGWFLGGQVESREGRVRISVNSELVPASADDLEASLSTEYGVPVHALSEGDEPAPPQSSGAESAAEQYANRYDVSVEEAQRRLELQPAAGDLGVELEINAGDRHAGTWLQHDPQFRLVLNLAGNEPPGADIVDLAESAPLPVDVRTGAEHTYEELQAAQGAVHEDTRGSTIGTSVGVQENAVVVYWSSELTGAEENHIADRLSDEHNVRVAVRGANSDP